MHAKGAGQRDKNVDVIAMTGRYHLVAIDAILGVSTLTSVPLRRELANAFALEQCMRGK